jgi:DNA-binding response OmpR family regulator
VLKRGDLTIDPERHVVYKGSEEIALTKTEFALLYAMARRPSKVFSRLQLMDEALGEAFVGYERTIDSHIRNLRKKLERGDESRYIVTVHGIGYKFEVG